MGKGRLINCLINTEKRLRKASEILFYENDLDSLNEKERKIVEKMMATFKKEFYDLRRYIDGVLLFLSIEKQTAVGKSIDEKFLGQTKEV